MTDGRTETDTGANQYQLATEADDQTLAELKCPVEGQAGLAVTTLPFHCIGKEHVPMATIMLNYN